MAHTVLLVTLIATYLMTAHAQAVDYTVTNNANWAGFENEIGTDYARQALMDASQFIWDIFGQQNPSDRKPVQAVSLLIENGDGVAATSGDRISFSADYLQKFTGDRKREFTGIIYHESTHVWQWDGNRQTPGWLIEGIADFVRLKANYKANGWVEQGGGNSWQETYSGATAWFLDYCDKLGNNAFVAQLNAKMRTGYDDGFFAELLGKSIPELWSDYKAAYNKG